MINGEKIGVGIITCSREDSFSKLFSSLKKCDIIDKLYITEDSKVDCGDVGINTRSYIKKYLLEWSGDIDATVNNINYGVGKCKNICLEKLLSDGCDHIFLIEDDMYIKDDRVFEKYIEASKVSGIQHFNYGPGSPFNRKQDIQFDLHNRHLLDQKSEPNPRLTIDYGDIKIDLYEHTVAMFSYYSRKSLETVGLIDENYLNAWEHVDHTYEIIKAGMHPPFWYFADLHNSLDLVEEQENAITQSVIAEDTEQWTKNVMGGREIYKNKHGHYPNQPPFVSEEEALKIIKQLKP